MDIENKFPAYGKCNDDERKLIDRAVSTLYGNIIHKPQGDETFVFAKNISGRMELGQRFSHIGDELL